MLNWKALIITVALITPIVIRMFWPGYNAAGAGIGRVPSILPKKLRRRVPPKPRWL